MPWYVLYTKSRNEKKVAQQLSDKGVQVYCPLAETIRQWSDRKKKVKQPVFPSYVFVHMSDYKAENTDILSLPGAVRFLWWLGKPGVVRDEEIKAIQDFLSSYHTASITIRVEPGQKVRINEGPFKDKSGQILQIRGRKVSLHLQSLGYNLIAEIPIGSVTVDNFPSAKE